MTQARGRASVSRTGRFTLEHLGANRNDPATADPQLAGPSAAGSRARGTRVQVSERFPRRPSKPQVLCAPGGKHPRTWPPRHVTSAIFPSPGAPPVGGEQARWFRPPAELFDDEKPARCPPGPAASRTARVPYRAAEHPPPLSMGVWSPNDDHRQAPGWAPGPGPNVAECPRPGVPAARTSRQVFSVRLLVPVPPTSRPKMGQGQMTHF